MQELERNLAQANEYLDKVENVKEDAMTAAEHSRAFVRIHEATEERELPWLHFEIERRQSQTRTGNYA